MVFLWQMCSILTGDSWRHFTGYFIKRYPCILSLGVHILNMNLFFLFKGLIDNTYMQARQQIVWFVRVWSCEQKNIGYIFFSPLFNPGWLIIFIYPTLYLRWMQSTEINPLNLNSEKVLISRLEYKITYAHDQELSCDIRRMRRGFTYLVMSRPFSGQLCLDITWQARNPASSYKYPVQYVSYIMNQTIVPKWLLIICSYYWADVIFFFSLWSDFFYSRSFVDIARISSGKNAFNVI